MQENQWFFKINEASFNTQSTYFRTRQPKSGRDKVMDGDRGVIHKKGHVSLLYRLIINMISLKSDRVILQNIHKKK